jgi:hypothetical protein
LEVPHLPFIGITPSPGDVTHTAFQSYVSEKYFNSQPQGGRELNRADESARYSAAIAALRQGEPPDTTDMTQAEIKSLHTRAHIPLVQSSFTRMDILSQVHAYKLASDKEKQQYHLRNILLKNARSRIANMPPSQRQQAGAAVRAAVLQ